MTGYQFAYYMCKKKRYGTGLRGILIIKKQGGGGGAGKERME